MEENINVNDNSELQYYPVIVGTLNRYEHFKSCIESLAACTHADKTEIVIGFDYPPSKKYEEGYFKIKKYLSTLNDKGFGKVTVFERAFNFGPTKNYNGLIDYAFSKYDAYILTEDDNVFSPCFLDYMAKCLHKYKDNPKVIAISGYMTPIEWNQKKVGNVVYLQDYVAWGVGVWKAKQDFINSTMPEHYMKYVCTHRKLLKKLKNKSLRDLYQLIFWTKSNPLLDKKCDFTYSCYLLLNDLYVINPTFSLVRNVGYDGSGINCGYFENDFHKNQRISADTIYDVSDSLSIDEQQEVILKWNNIKDIFGNFNKKEKKRVLRIYRKYMILGYTLTEIVLKIDSLIKGKIYKVLRVPYRFIKNMIINSNQRH